MPDTPWNVDHHALMQFDLFLIKPHSPLPLDHIVKFIRSLMEVKLGLSNFNLADFTRGPIRGFDQKSDLSARLRPRLDLGRVATKVFAFGNHDLVGFSIVHSA